MRELLDEWTIGFEIGSSVEDQTERELIAKLADPSIQYLDYFTGDFDHVAHAASDAASQRLALQRIDALDRPRLDRHRIQPACRPDRARRRLRSRHEYRNPASTARATICCISSTAAPAAGITW